jgi:DNA-binding MarR family transcriptional regulator
MTEAGGVLDGLGQLPNQELVADAVRFTKAFQRSLGRRPDGSLSYERARLLQTLHCDGPQRTRDLADELDLPARNVTTVADALEGEDLVRRTPHPTDRRVTLLELTPAGRAAVERDLVPRLAEIDAVFDVLSSAEKGALGASLARLVDVLDRGAPR